MKLNKNPFAWVLLVVLLGFLALRILNDVKDGDGVSSLLWALVLVALILGVTFAIIKSKTSNTVDGVKALRPQALVIVNSATDAGIAAHKHLAITQGKKAKGTLISPVITADYQEIAVWYGGKNPKVSVAMPSASVEHVVAAAINQGIRSVPSIVVAQSDGTGIVISPKLVDGQTLEGVANQVARAIGFPAEKVEIVGSN